MGGPIDMERKSCVLIIHDHDSDLWWPWKRWVDISDSKRGDFRYGRAVDASSYVMFVEWKIETVVAFRFIRPVSNTYQEQEQQPYAHDMVKDIVPLSGEWQTGPGGTVGVVSSLRPRGVKGIHRYCKPIYISLYQVLKHIRSCLSTQCPVYTRKPLSRATP